MPSILTLWWNRLIQWLGIKKKLKLGFFEDGVTEMEKREYVEQMAEKITEYSGKLHELRGQVFLVQTDMRKEYLTRMKVLEHKQDKLRETYGHVKEASIIN